jgi:hypothetical protein
VSSLAEKDVYKHSKGGNFERLNNINYPSWSANMKRLLKAAKCRSIVEGTELDTSENPTATVTLNGGAVRPGVITARILSKQSWSERYNEAALIIHNAVSVAAGFSLVSSSVPSTMLLHFGAFRSRFMLVDHDG